MGDDSGSDLELAYDSGSEADSDSEEDPEFVKKAVLGVNLADVVNYDLAKPPENGSQYLLTVLAEAKHIPKVAHVDRNSIPTRKNKDEIATSLGVGLLNLLLESNEKKCNLDRRYLPEPEWEREVIQEFTELRMKLSQSRSLILNGDIRLAEMKLPQEGSDPLWLKFFFGQEFSKLFDPTGGNKKVMLTREMFRTPPNEEDPDLLHGSHPPYKTLLLHLPQRTIEYLIDRNTKWLKLQGLINVRQAEWLYSLFASVQKPLEPSVVADMRQMVRILISERAKLCRNFDNIQIAAEYQTCNDQTEEDFLEAEEEMKFFWELLKNYNLFISIVANYFEQKDLTAQ